MRYVVLFILFCTEALIGSGVINSDLTANQNDRYMKLFIVFKLGNSRVINDDL